MRTCLDEACEAAAPDLKTLPFSMVTAERCLRAWPARLKPAWWL